MKPRPPLTVLDGGAGRAGSDVALPAAAAPEQTSATPRCEPVYAHVGRSTPSPAARATAPRPLSQAEQAAHAPAGLARAMRRAEAAHSTASERQAELMRAAQAAAHSAGERAGYVAGWLWGAVCGFLAGLTAGALLVAGALQLGLRLGGLLP